MVGVLFEDEVGGGGTEDTRVSEAGWAPKCLFLFLFGWRDPTKRRGTEMNAVAFKLSFQ